MTSGLRWPWWGILNRRGNRGRMMCKSSLSPLGAITQMCQLYTASFEAPVKRDTHIFRHAAVHKSGWRGRDPWQVKISCVRFPHDGPVNYWTELVLLIHASVCTQRLSHLSDTPLHTHTWLQGFFFLFFFSFFFLHVSATGADGTLCGTPQFISYFYFFFFNSAASTCLSPPQIRQRISPARCHYWNA